MAAPEIPEFVRAILLHAAEGYYPFGDVHYLTLLVGGGASRLARVITCPGPDFLLTHILQFALPPLPGEQAYWDFHGVSMLHTDERIPYIGGREGRAASLARTVLELQGLDNVRVGPRLELPGEERPAAAATGLTTVTQDPIE